MTEDYGFESDQSGPWAHGDRTSLDSNPPMASITLPDGQMLLAEVHERRQEADGSWWSLVTATLIVRCESASGRLTAEPEPVNFWAPTADGVAAARPARAGVVAAGAPRSADPRAGPGQPGRLGGLPDSAGTVSEAGQADLDMTGHQSLASCGRAWASRRESPGLDAPGTVELAFRPVGAGGWYTPSNPLIAVPGVDLLRSRQELELFQEAPFLQFFPEGEPKLDWSGESLLVARLGMRPNSGYDVDVDRVTLHGSTLTVDLFEKRPGAGDVAMACIYPVTAAVIPAVPAGTAVRWRHTDLPDCGLPGYRPQPLSGAEAVIDAHGRALRELVGRRLERIWEPWDPDSDRWCYDYPVILDIGGTQVEFQRNNANDTFLTFNSIDPSAVISPPTGSGYRNVVWRPPPTAELSALHSRAVTKVVVVEWCEPEDERNGCTALGIRFGEDWITVQNDYARFGLSREKPPAGVRWHAL